MRNTGIARLAVAAGMSFAAMTSMLPTIPAMAAVNYGTGSIVINKVDGNGTVTYDGYQIFKANVTDDASAGNATGKTETNVAWANDDVKSAVETLIKAEDSSYAGKTAEDAATFISGKITGTDNATRVDSKSFANKLAKAVDGKTSTTSVTPGTAATIGEGYWLFVTNTATDGKSNSVGTAPIFAVVGGATQVTVTEKTSVPTIDKKVKNDATGAKFASVADAEAGQSVSYELTGTVADNVATTPTSMPSPTSSPQDSSPTRIPSRSPSMARRLPLTATRRAMTPARTPCPSRSRTSRQRRPPTDRQSPSKNHRRS